MNSKLSKKKEEIKLREIAIQTTIKNQENIAYCYKFKLFVISTFMCLLLASFAMKLVVEDFVQSVENWMTGFHQKLLKINSKICKKKEEIK